MKNTSENMSNLSKAKYVFAYCKASTKGLGDPKLIMVIIPEV